VRGRISQGAKEPGANRLGAKRQRGEKARYRKLTPLFPQKCTPLFPRKLTRNLLNDVTDCALVVMGQFIVDEVTICAESVRRR